MPRSTVEILGPLRISVADRLVTPTSPRLRSLVAVLAMSAGRVVPVEHLISALWGDGLPANPRSSLHTSLSRLRTAIGRDRIGTLPMGVVLRIDPDDVDALRFERLLDRAARVTDPIGKRALLGDALALWQGAPFEDVESETLHRTWAPRLVERYLAAMEERIDLDMAAGRHEGLIPLLGELTEVHRLRESLWIRYLTVLRHAGRHAEALERYEAVRRRIAEELGSDPGAGLRRIHAELLAEAGPTVAPKPAPVPPNLLPIGVAGFVGRDGDLDRLDEIHTGDSHTTTIAVVTGAAGIGKTTLAVRWAHRVAARYPDGRLYVDLRGFDPAAEPLAPGEALRQFLDAFDIPADRVPADPSAQVNLYRTLLSGKRVLIVLDNARDADQVRLLLPNSPGAMVVVTSRDQLTGLVTQGARPVGLDLLPAAEAGRLLSARLGPARVAAEPEAAAEIVERCAGLPLALSIAAARAALHPEFRLADLAAELRDVHKGLDGLSTQDPSTDLRAVFSWSYRATSPAAARLFRLMSLHPGPDVSTAATISLDGRPAADVRASLAELCRTSLLEERTPGRYVLHDLLRAYATELAEAHDSDEDRHETVGRILDHYLHSAFQADLLLDRHHRSIEPPPARPGVVPERPRDIVEARAWFAAEHRAAIGVHARSAAGGDPHLWHLTWYLSVYLVWRGYQREVTSLWEDTFAIARKYGDTETEALGLRVLARVDMAAGLHEQARARLERSLELGELSNDLTGCAAAYRTLGMVCGKQGRYDAALGYARRAIDLYRLLGERANMASALNAAGWYHAMMGEYRPALEHCERAVALLEQDPGERIRLGSTWDSIGYIRFRMNELDEAVACYERAIEVLEELGMGTHLPHALEGLGDVHQARGDIEEARRVWRRAYETLAAIGHVDAGAVAAKLDAVGPGGRGGEPRPPGPDHQARIRS